MKGFKADLIGQPFQCYSMYVLNNFDVTSSNVLVLREQKGVTGGGGLIYPKGEKRVWAWL